MNRPAGIELTRIAYYVLLFAPLAFVHLSMSRYAFDGAPGQRAGEAAEVMQ